MTPRLRLGLTAAASVALAAAFVLLGLDAYRTLIHDGPPLHADEAGHALPAARVALALGQGDLRGFAAASLRELVWPFVHPWVIASGFLVFGVSAAVARTVSLVSFGAGLCLLPGFARAITPGEASARGAAPPLIGWLSAAILVTSNPWELVSTVMGEALGMLLTLATLWAAARAAGERGLALHALTGLLAAAAFLTKYSYGLPLIAAVLLALAWRFREIGPRPIVAALVSALAPLAAWALAAVGGDPRRLETLLAVLVNRDEGLHGLDNALFYVRATLDFVGWPLGSLVLLLLVATALRRPEAARLPALLFLATALLLLTLHPNKQQRYLFPLLPVMLALAETEAARQLGRRVAWLRLWPVLALSVLMVRNPLDHLDDAAASAAPLRGSRTIVEYVADHVATRQPVLFLGTTGLLPHDALAWELLEREEREASVELLPFPGDEGWDPRYRTGYPEAMRPEYAQQLSQALAGGRYRSVVTLALGDDSPFRPAWLARWDAWGQNYARAMDEQAGASGLELLAEREFPHERARVRVFVPGRR